jgi:hypothetical protein
MFGGFTSPLAMEGFGGDDANCALSRPLLLCRESVATAP